MRILHINTTDIIGGAGIAAYRLHTALRNEGIESFMLVQYKKSEDEFVLKNCSFPYINKIRSEIDYLPLKFVLNDKNSIFSVAWLKNNIYKKIKELKPDIIHFHWINNGFVNIESLKKMNIPIIWSLHDMWPFTGGCHYDNECGKYKTECTNCPMLKKNSKLSERVFRRKKQTYSKIKNLHVNGLSKWLANCASVSSLFSENTIHNIPNCIDVNQFSPISKEDAKKQLSFPENKKVILFGAVAATKDKRKGYDLLEKALLKINVKSDKILTVFGSDKKQRIKKNNFEFFYLGHISDPKQMQIIYSAADVIVIPSRQENLSNIVMEALSCGTPVVAFDIGGMPDFIVHKKNGYLAKNFDTTDLLNGIEWAINNDNYKQISENARKTVKSKFESSIVAKQYIETYKNIIAESPKKVSN